MKKDESRFLRTLAGEPSAIPPIWFMRQAGRYLPEYRATRTEAGSFLDLCFNPALAAEVTLQPIRRYDLDAAILFSDILVIPWAFGQELRFVEGEGPRLSPPADAAALDGYRGRNVVEALSPVFETVSRVRAALPSDKALIGFAGAPWTVATYMLAGGPTKDPAALRMRYYRDPAFVTALIDLIVDATVDYLIAQVDAGADALQLFDTWAGGLPPAVLDAVSVRPMIDIARRVREARPDIPFILFPKGVGEKAVDYAAFKECAAVGIDYAMDPTWARAQLSPLAAVQGGMDPLLTVVGGAPMLKAAETYLRLFHDAPYVFNLGHGFSPDVDPQHVADLVAYVRSGAWRD